LHVTDVNLKTAQTGDFASSERQRHKRKSSFRSRQQFLSVLLLFTVLQNKTETQLYIFFINCHCFIV